MKLNMMVNNEVKQLGKNPREERRGEVRREERRGEKWVRRLFINSGTLIMLISIVSVSDTYFILNSTR